MDKVFIIIDETGYFVGTRIDAIDMHGAIMSIKNTINEDIDYGDADNTICIIDLENMESTFITTETIKTRRVEFKIKE